MNKPILMIIVFMAMSISLYSQTCLPTENQATYGTGNRWRGYVYQGTGFDLYRGMVQQGTTLSPNFDQSFGGAKVNYNTSACSIVTDTFSVRYRLTKNFTPGIYTFVVGADAGYRLSMDGGLTWAVSNWIAHTYTTSSYNVTLSGPYDLVLEYYDNLGSNRVTFSMIQNTVLPVKLLAFSGKPGADGVALSWQVTADSDVEVFAIERSSDGSQFETIGSVKGSDRTGYQFTDKGPVITKRYYRLKIIDQTGMVSYSGIISLRSINALTEGDIKLFPTVIGGTTLSITSSRTLQDVSLLILDAAGRAVLRQGGLKFNRGTVSRIETSSSKLPAGLYFLILLEKDQTMTTSRFIVN